MSNEHNCNDCPYPKSSVGHETDMEQLLKSLLGNIDSEEMADLVARSYERRIVRKDTALKNAQAILRKAQRPVRRQDMLIAMELAIMDRVCIFEKNADIGNSILLFATIICKNMLTDGPLHEED